MKTMVTLLALLFCLTAKAQEAAIKALSSLEAKTEAGLTLTEYMAALGEANYEVKQFRQGPKAKEKPELGLALDTAMRRYIEAGQLWPSGTIGANTAVGKTILARYPQAAKDLADGGVLTTSVPIDGVRYSTIHTRFLMPFLWRDAANNLEQARKLAQ